MPPPLGAVLGVAVPVAISSVALVVSWRPWRLGAARGNWGSIVGVGVGFAAGAVAVQGYKGVLPVPSVTDYLPHLAAIVVLAGLLAGRCKGAGARALIGIVACAAGTALATRIRPTAQLQPALLVTGVLAVGMMALWGALSLASRASGGARTPLALIVGLSATSIAMIQSQTASLAQVCGCLAAALGPVMVLAFWRPGWNVWRCLALPVAVIGAGLIGAWRLTTFDVSPWSHASALGALLSPALGALPLVRRGRPWIGAVLVLIVAAALGVLAIRLAPSGFDFSGLS